MVWVTVGAIATVVAAAAAAGTAGYSAYQQGQTAKAQAKAGKAQMEMQQEAEKAAGEARRRQVLYDAEKKKQMMASREAAAGVQVGEGSLLEDEMQFAHDAAYNAEMAAYPHALQANLAGFKGKIYKGEGQYAADTQGLSTGIAVGGSLASSAGNYARSKPSAITPTPTESYDV